MGWALAVVGAVLIIWGTQLSMGWMIGMMAVGFVLFALGMLQINGEMQI